MIPYKQLSLADIYCECENIYENDKPKFLTLLEEHINLEEIIPPSFYYHFHSWTGRPREYPLRGFLWALLIQKIFSIPRDELLLTFLHYSKELREFCGFDKVPDPSKITRFKQDFVEDLQSVFDRLVDMTEPICQIIDAAKADMTIFDTSGIEAYVTENNPKFADRLIRQMKSWAKTMKFGESFDPYKAAYSNMPTHAHANPEIKQQYINSHFCYAYKFGLVTNGLGIVRHIAFYNKDWLAAHPDIVLEKKSDSPDEDKSAHDVKLLIPTLKDFFAIHPLYNPKTFLGDAAFDAIQIYKGLLSGDTFGIGRHFAKAYIPLNVARLENSDYTINEDGIPCCPNDSSLPMKPEGNTSHLRCGLPTFKFVCPKMRYIKCDDRKYHRRTLCDNPCTSSKCGRMVYVYPEKDLRAYPGTIRGTPLWDSTYKIRTAVERSIAHFKDSFGLAHRRSQNPLTFRADLLLAGIAQLFTLLLADKLHRRDLFRSLKSLVAA